MNFKKFFFIIFFLLSSCVNYPIEIKKEKLEFKKGYTNKGFALIYSKNLYNNKIVNNKLNERSLEILHLKLEKNTIVKIRNLLNEKTIIAKVGLKSEVPNFYNSVISERISNELDLDLSEPYIEITEIMNNSLFVAKKAKTFDEEKKVANKAPVESISIDNLDQDDVKKVNKKKKKLPFNYLIKVADFYFKDSALEMKKRLSTELLQKKLVLKK